MEAILVWLSGSLLFGYISKILSLPIVVGFIFSGFFFSLLDYSDINGILDLPSKIGVELLLFSIGLKVKPSSFLSKSFINVFFLHSIFVTIIYFILISLNTNLEIRILLCIILTFSSTVIASKSLEDRKEINSFHGRNSILILIFQDILALLLLIYSDQMKVSFYLLFILPIIICVPIIIKFLEKLKTSHELELVASIVIGLFFWRILI